MVESSLPRSFRSAQRRTTTRRAESTRGRGDARSRSRYFWEENPGRIRRFQERTILPLVITVCDEASAKRCPIFPGVTQRLRWSFPDPSALTGTYEGRLEGTRKIRDQIRARVEMWCDKVRAVEA